MSTSPEPQPENSNAPHVGCALLGLLMFGWAATIVFSVNEPSLLAAIIGIPTFILTPVVTGGLLIALRHSKHSSRFHKAVFYISAAMVALWLIAFFLAVCSK